MSNQGGRQVDGAAATLDLLPRIVDAVDENSAGDGVAVFLGRGVRMLAAH